MSKKVIKVLALLCMVVAVIMMVVPVNASYSSEMSKLITASEKDVETGASKSATSVVATVICKMIFGL